jgi:hypothetical protein
MDVSHLVVGGLTAVSVALLVWVEIRSRRNVVAQEQNAPSMPLSEAKTPEKEVP